MSGRSHESRLKALEKDQVGAATVFFMAILCLMLISTTLILLLERRNREGSREGQGSASEFSTDGFCLDITTGRPCEDSPRPAESFGRDLQVSA